MLAFDVYDCDWSFCEWASVYLTACGGYCNATPYNYIGALALARSIAVNTTSWFGACLVSHMIVTTFIVQR